MSNVPLRLPLNSDDPNDVMRRLVTYAFAISRMYKADGGPADGLLEYRCPSHYMPGVGRQVMADGGAPSYSAPITGQHTITLDDLIGRAPGPASQMGAYMDAGGQRIAAPFVTSTAGGYPVYSPQTQPAKASNPYDVSGLLGRIFGKGRQGYATQGGVPEVEDALRVAREAQDREAMSHPVGMSGKVEFAPVRLREPLSGYEIPLGSLPKESAPAANAMLDTAERFAPYAFGPLAGSAYDMAVGAKEGSMADVATGALGLPGKAAKAAGILGSTLIGGDAEAGPIAKALKLARSAVPELRASTRFPTGKTATENPLTQQLSIGLDEMRRDPTFAHNVSLLSEYPGFGKLRGMSQDEAAEAYIDQARGNLNFLWENSPDVMKERSPHWYEGANRISDALASRYGVPRQSASAAIAALSPQMDWFKNASLAERVGDILLGSTASKKMTPEMERFARSSSALSTPANADIVNSIVGKTLSQIDDPLEKAMWIRLYDEAHNPRHYRTITPEGAIGDYITTGKGDPAKIGWGALGEIAKAVQAYESGGDMNIISPLLGTKHKVRSFYNNIELPNDPRFGDVTADTHQVAAAQLRPLSGNTPAVAHNLASGLAKAAQPVGYRAEKSSAISGVQGTYGLNADATRRAAADQGLIPRAMQSGTWEPVRELFPAAMKRGNTDIVDDIWRAHDAGEIGLDAARRAIFEAAGGIGTPAWARPGLKEADPARASTYR